MSEHDVEIRREIETMRRELAAVQAVNEQITTCFMASIAALTDNPPEYIRGIMIKVEDALAKAARAAEKADPETKQRADDAVAYANDLSLRMIAAITPRDRPQ
ncbi:hypothetical protein [Martelella sp. FOR1707]